MHHGLWKLHSRDALLNEGPCTPLSSNLPKSDLRLSDPCIIRVVHLQATGSTAAAAVLADLHVRRVPHGGPTGMQQVASSLIKVRDTGWTCYADWQANIGERRGCQTCSWKAPTIRLAWSHTVAQQRACHGACICARMHACMRLPCTRAVSSY